jgi:Uncharacterised nucleotidyltransferase
LCAGDEPSVTPDIRLYAAILSGALRAWPEDGPDPEGAVHGAVAHGVAALLARKIGRGGRAWPRSFADGLADAARGEMALAGIRERVLPPILDALAEGGVRVLVFKGAHLAHAVYESPELRPRRDTDLLIEETDRDRTRAILERLGYRHVPHVTGSLVMPQFHFRRLDRSGATDQLDVHWRLAVPQAFSGLPTLADLWDASPPIPMLGRAARGLSLADALLVACAHQAAHHSERRILIWIVDVQRIAERLSDREATTFVERATRARVRAVAGHALSIARDLLGARLAPPLAVLAGEVVGRSELSAAYLSPVGPFHGLTLDLRALDGWSARTRLLREQLFPPPAYMHAYAPRSRWPMPVLYLRRMVSGASRWLTADRRGSR